jgi:hypothetical protein
MLTSVLTKCSVRLWSGGGFQLDLNAVHVSAARNFVEHEAEAVIPLPERDVGLRRRGLARFGAAERGLPAFGGLRPTVPDCGAFLN